MVVIVFRIKRVFRELWYHCNRNHFIFRILETVNPSLFVNLQIKTGILDTEMKCQFLEPASTEWTNWDALFRN